MIGAQNAAGKWSGAAVALAGDGLRMIALLAVSAGPLVLAACTGLTGPMLAAPDPPAAGGGNSTLDVAKLRGLSSAEIVALLGQPDFRRAEPPAELWQYRGAACVLDVFLYGDEQGFRVLHSEMRGRSATGGRCGPERAASGEQERQSRL